MLDIINILSASHHISNHSLIYATYGISEYVSGSHYLFVHYLKNGMQKNEKKIALAPLGCQSDCSTDCHHKGFWEGQYIDPAPCTS